MVASRKKLGTKFWQVRGTEVFILPIFIIFGCIILKNQIKQSNNGSKLNKMQQLARLICHTSLVVNCPRNDKVPQLTANAIATPVPHEGRDMFEVNECRQSGR